MSLLGFGIRTMLASFHMGGGGIMFVLRAGFNMFVRNESLSGPLCYNGMMFSLSELVSCYSLLCCITCWTGVVVSVMLYYCILCVVLFMDLAVLCVACLTVYVNCLVKQLAICLSLVVILLLNVMEVFSVSGGVLLDRPCMVFKE